MEGIQQRIVLNTAKVNQQKVNRAKSDSEYNERKVGGEARGKAIAERGSTERHNSALLSDSRRAADAGNHIAFSGSGSEWARRMRRAAAAALGPSQGQGQGKQDSGS